MSVTDQRTYPPGVPCWVDSGQPDLDEAARFYGALFGWRFEDAMPPGAPGSYLIATLDGRDVAALAPGQGDARWTTYLACADADMTAEVVAASGGRVTGAPQDAGPGGRTATCADPEGSEFRLWQARRRLGAQLVNAPDTWNFSDLHTATPQRTLAFYADVFGWEHDAGDATGLQGGMVRVPGYGDHLAATVDPHIRERQAAAPPGFADVVAGWSVTDREPGWHVRFAVADRDRSVGTAERHGAVVLSTADTGWTREAVVRDPQGAELTLSQFSPPS
jgi:predicted enzyme related to lactoylglutathione lyase